MELRQDNRAHALPSGYEQSANIGSKCRVPELLYSAIISIVPFLAADARIQATNGTVSRAFESSSTAGLHITRTYEGGEKLRG